MKSGEKKGQTSDSERKPVGWKPVALDGGYGWVVVLGSFLIHVFADGFVYSFGVIAESLIKEFNATNAEVSTILSLLTGLMLATGPLASAICNRIGCRITTIVGAIIASIGCALSFYANSMTYLILSVGIVMGTGFGLMYCPAIVIVTMYFEKYRALATGVTVCGAGVGTFVFSKIIGYLIETFDWRTVFIIYAGLVLLCVPCGALYRPVMFEPIYDDDDKFGLRINEGKTNEEVEEASDEKEKAAILTQRVQAPRKKLTSMNAAHAEPIPEAAEERSSEEDLPGAAGQQSPVPSEDVKGLRRKSASVSNHKHTRRFSKEEPGNGTEATVIRPAVSQVLVESTKIGSMEEPANGNAAGGGGVLQRFLSLGEHLHTRANEGGKISVSTGYLNIKDVFYPGSISALPEYAENQTRFRSVSSLHSERDRTASKIGKHSEGGALIADQIIEEKAEDEDEDEKEEDSSATSASRAIEVWRTIKRLMDLSLLADPIYLLFAVSNFLTSIGFNAPPMFMPMNAESVLGLSKGESANTVSAYGLANTFGRIAFGLTCDRQLPFRWGKNLPRNRLWIYNLTLMLCGLASCFVFTMQSYVAFTAYCFFFGFTISSYVCLTSVVLVDLVGVDRLTNAFGLLLFIQGVATFVGPPLAGQLYDLTKRYDWTFGFCGVCLFVSGIMLFVVPTIQRRNHNRSRRPTEQDVPNGKCRLDYGSLENGKAPLVEC
ncbi:major facilitator superfamily domain-containing protein [Ditylenchus destructor]|uniref:Major facilitator superfamily domain-containing protein n=1 Tax=Ditylenchus destructor TaxID=166010 RepID=A0AAD4MQT3_9BILA|nr:major facilitator superfamily domain-containing protein [Ditylenchus destructor]